MVLNDISQFCFDRVMSDTSSSPVADEVIQEPTPSTQHQPIVFPEFVMITESESHPALLSQVQDVEILTEETFTEPMDVSPGEWLMKYFQHIVIVTFLFYHHRKCRFLGDVA